MNVLEFSHCISDELKAKLLEGALSAKYTHHITSWGEVIGLEWADASNVDASELTNLIPFTPNGQLFIKFNAGEHIDLHIDDTPSRVSCLSVALLPSYDKFTPVNYYNSMDADAELVETYYYNEHPVVLNTMAVHAVFDVKYDRYMFQLMYTNPIEDFVKYADSSS